MRSSSAPARSTTSTRTSAAAIRPAPPGFGTPATTGQQHEARPPRARRPAAGDRHVAALPAGHARRQAADRSVYAAGAMRRREHCAGLLLGLVLVLLGGRALAYAATPTPLAGELGGPRLPVIAAVALAVGGAARRSACSGSPRSACASVTRSSSRPGRAPRLSLARFGLDSALLERRLAGRVRGARDLDPLARRHAHALVAVPRGPRAPQCGADPARALARGGRRCSRPCATSLAWARRVVGVLRRLLQPRAAARPRPLASRRIAAPGWLLARALRARGPPALSLP